MQRLVHFFLFDFVWFFAVWGRDQWLWLTALLVVVLYATAWRFLWEQKWPLLILIALGLLAEYLVVAAGVLQFTGTNGLPMWLVLLWVGFAAMALVVFGWLGRRYWLAAVLGVVFGPITYFAGVRLDAAQMLMSPWLVGASYALMWALLMMLIIYLQPKSAIGAEKDPLQAKPEP